MNYSSESNGQWGWSGHGDDGDPDGMSGLGAMAGDVGWSAGDKLEYQPNLQPVGHGVGYWPGDVRADAMALSFMGYPGATDGRPSTGSQQGDMGESCVDVGAGVDPVYECTPLSGAWDPQFRAAVSAFQSASGGTVDGWIGSSTRTILAQAVSSKNAAGGYGGGGAAPGGGGAAPGGGTTTAPETSSMLLVLGGVTALAAGAWWLLKRHT